MAERLLGLPVAEVTELGASHGWRLRRVTLADGRTVFVKRARRDVDGVFPAEAAGLRWLRSATESAPVPEVLAVDDTSIVLPWIETAEPTREAAERFGRDLAAVHASGADGYGAPWRGFIAELPLDNGGGRSWPEWYATRRVLPYLRLSVDRGALSLVDAAEVERVVEAFAGPEEPPARIHGDLWSGNVLWGGGRGWLIDPAAHGGHRETDLAMLALFGAPWLDRIIAAYDEVFPLAGGWRTRVPMHQLHPLLVHASLFGAGYRSQVLATARAAS
jgi:fructosamine-3-kinase